MSAKKSFFILLLIILISSICSFAKADVDVLFLTDTTGSMSGPINGFKTALSGILTAIDACSPCPDIMYSVSDYRNYTDGGNYHAYGVNLVQPFTSDTNVVQAAINGLSAGGGEDRAESQLKGMVNIANNWLTPAGDLGFNGRANAQKILIWAGDAHGHIAGDELGSSGSPPAGYYPTLDATIDALTAQGIMVFALNTYDCDSGLNLPYGGLFDQTPQRQQADEITSATGGTLFCNIGSGGSSIEDAIVAAIICECYLILEKVDDVNDGDCVAPDANITYTIDYNYPAGPNLPDINDVNLIDELPGDVEFISATEPNCTHPDANTVIWNIGTLHPGDAGFVTLTVKVKPCVEPGSIITNECELTSGGLALIRAYEDTPICGASNPRPTCGATDVPRDVVLSWRPGIDADTHDVYLGTDPCSLPLVSDNQDANTYDPCGLLKLGRTYYWRIDEVNEAGPDPCLWPGAVWSFTTVPYLVVEDFDSYANNPALTTVWKHGADNGSRAQLWVMTPTIDANLVQDGNSMEYEYVNLYDPYYAEADADTADLPSQIGSDWTAGGVKALVLSFYGQSDNDANEQMYVRLHDTDSNAVVTYSDYGEDPNDLRVEEWQEWNIDLEDFNSAGVDLTNVTRITIGFGDKGGSGGDGYVYFDNIRLYAPRCIPVLITADINNDCFVDYKDLKMMIDDWLKTPPSDPNTDLYGDGTIDFRDFAVLADRWLKDDLWPYQQ